MNSIESEQQKINHPAKFSDKFIPFFAEKLKGCKIVLDPMAGTGKVALIKKCGWKGIIICNEIEPEFAKLFNYPVDQWFFEDAVYIPLHSEFVDAICTSPTYGNRLADHWNRQEFSKRFSYTFCLGHALQSGNTGQMHWGDHYRQKHEAIYQECYRVLAPKGLFIINISDHIRQKQIIPVVDFHKQTLLKLGLNLIEDKTFPTQRLRYGSNAKARVEAEHILIFQK